MSPKKNPKAWFRYAVKCDRDRREYIDLHMRELNHTEDGHVNSERQRDWMGSGPNTMLALLAECDELEPVKDAGGCCGGPPVEKRRARPAGPSPGSEKRALELRLSVPQIMCFRDEADESLKTKGKAKKLPSNRAITKSFGLNAKEHEALEKSGASGRPRQST